MRLERPVGVSSTSLPATEHYVLLVVCWFAGMGPAVGGRRRFGGKRREQRRGIL